MSYHIHYRRGRPLTDPLPPQESKAALQIGNHRMTGALVMLPKPLLLIHREAPGAGTAAPAFVVRAVVRRKLLFDDRPQPLVSARK